MSYSQLFDMNSTNSTQHPRGSDNNQETGFLKQLRKISELQKITNDKLEHLETKFDRQAAEMLSLRTEVAFIKARVCGVVQKPKEILPQQPITQIEELKCFEQKLQEQHVFSNCVNQLLSSGEKAFDKFVRNSWRLIMSDEVARQCSWRGTDTKMCVRGLHITLAIRTAFKQKFALEDADFDRTTQKFFQYAQDRLSKGEKSNSKN